MRILGRHIGGRDVIGDATLFGAMGVALVLFLASPGTYKYPAVMITVVMFFGVQLMLPNSRLRLDSPLCPINVALLHFAMPLLITPMLILFGGPQLGTLPMLPEDSFFNLALLLNALAFVSFAVAFHFWRQRTVPGAAFASGEPPCRYPFRRPGLVVAGYLCAGALGMGLYFGSVDEYVNYISSPSYLDTFTHQNKGSLRAATGNLLRYFLPGGLILAWCLWIDHRRRHTQLPVAAGTAALVVSLILVTLGYNRASVAGPVAGVLTTYSQRVRRLRFSVLLTVGILFYALAAGWGTYRGTSLVLSDLLSLEGTSQIGEKLHVFNELQLYGGGPQFLGYFLQEVGYVGSPLYLGQTLVASVLHAVPVIGKPFREISGVGLYNQLIYRYFDSSDQVPPFVGELFVNFHFPGIIAGFALLGCITASFQKRFECARNSFETYAWFFVSMWTSFVITGSLSVVCQVCLYSFWPLYAYWLLTRIGKIDKRQTSFGAPVVEAVSLPFVAAPRRSPSP